VLEEIIGFGTDPTQLSVAVNQELTSLLASFPTGELSREQLIGTSQLNRL
jgi:hypothetical protein